MSRTHTNKILAFYLHSILIVFIVFYSLPSIAEDSYYCPKNNGYVQLGMTQSEVLAACGEPLSKTETDKPVMKEIPMQQLYYNSQGTPSAFYEFWTMPTGVDTGQKLEVDVIDGKVSAIVFNGESVNSSSLTSNISSKGYTNDFFTNELTVCSGSFRIGDPVERVYNACGDPPMLNSTFVKQPIVSKTKPQIWIYQPSEFEASVTMTFLDGVLQSIQ